MLVGGIALANVAEGFSVSEYVDGLFEFGEIVEAQDHRCRSSVASDDDSIVVLFDSVDELGEVFTYGSERVKESIRVRLPIESTDR